MPESAVIQPANLITPTNTRANTRAKAKRDRDSIVVARNSAATVPAATASTNINGSPTANATAAITTTEEATPAPTVAATVSFATPERAGDASGGSSTVGHSGGMAGDSAASEVKVTGRNTLRSTPPSSASKVGTTTAAATVTPPEEKGGGGGGGGASATAAPSPTSKSGGAGVPSSPPPAGAQTPSPQPAAVPAAKGNEAASVASSSATEDDVGLSPGAKRFGLRKRKPKSPTRGYEDDHEEESGHATATTGSKPSRSTTTATTTSSSTVGATKAAAATASKGPAGSAGTAPAPKSPRRSPSSTASTTAARNVTFSPVPPQVHGPLRGARTPTRKFDALPRLDEHKPPTPSINQFLSPDSPKKSDSKGKSKAGGKEREGRATPTNFATDFGKMLQSPSFQNGEGVFSWLQSPTGGGMFSPGGYISSTMNTPRSYGGPRTPRTPNDRAGFFFQDVAGLPHRNEPYSPRVTGRRHPQHPLSNLICVSPLATNKSKTGTPINYKSIFDSPPGRYPSGRGAPYMGSKGKKNKKGQAPTLEAVHMAERDLMEDEDLSVLLQLAATTQTPRDIGQADGRMRHAAPSNLQLPMVGRGEGGKKNGSPSTKLVPRKDSPGARHQKHRHSSLDDFRPPALPSRTGPGGSVGPYPDKYAAVARASKKAGESKAGGNKGGKTPSKGTKIPSPTDGNPPKHPGHPDSTQYAAPPPPGARGHPPFMGYSMPPGWKPGAGPPRGHHGGPYHGPPPPGYAMHPRGSVGKAPPPQGGRGPPYPPHVAPYHLMFPPHQRHPHHPMNMYGQAPQPPKSGGGGALPTKSPVKPPAKATEKTKTATKRKSTAGSQMGPATTKKSKSSNPKRKRSRKPSSASSGTVGAPADRQKSAKAIQAVNASAGGKNDKAAALAAAILRGVTMRPSGKWQAQMYFAGKSRYIGVFDTREKAALAYEIAREKLQNAKSSATSLKATEDAVNEARKAAFDGVNEKDPRKK